MSHLSDAVNPVVDKVVFPDVVAIPQGPGEGRLGFEALGQCQLVCCEQLRGAGPEAGGEGGVLGPGHLGVGEAQRPLQLDPRLPLGTKQELREHRVDGEWGEHKVCGGGQF